MKALIPREAVELVASAAGELARERLSNSPDLRSAEDALAAARQDAEGQILRRYGIDVGALDRTVRDEVRKDRLAAIVMLARRPDFHALCDELAALDQQAREASEALSRAWPQLCEGGCGRYFASGELRAADVPGSALVALCPECLASSRRADAQRLARRSIRSALTRARAAGRASSLTEEEWRATLTFFGDACAYCGGTWYVVDHLLPINRGGGTTVDNCVPSCYRCNSLTVEGLVEKERIDKILLFRRSVQ